MLLILRDEVWGDRFDGVLAVERPSLCSSL